MSARDRLRRFIVPAEGRRLEYLARVVTAGLLCGFAVTLVAGNAWRRGSSGQTIDLVARQPAAGGWSRERIVVKQGERVRLRIRSEDVVHGFAIGRLGVAAGPIEPGKVTTVEFVADRAGEFTFYCTTWCDPNHPRMRGILEVRGPAAFPPPSAAPATDVTLQHLDDPRDAGVVPVAKPSAARGLPLYAARCASCHGGRGEGTPRGGVLRGRTFLDGRSPIGLFNLLTEQGTLGTAVRLSGHGPAAPVTAQAGGSHAKSTEGWSDQERWDVVATLWSFGTTAGRLDLGHRLYQTNCAACHGERGQGDGPGGTRQPKTPANFTDRRRMLAGTSALYTAKIRRGGMGTGMPYWGSIFTEDELAALLDYVWTFSMETVR